MLFCVTARTCYVMRMVLVNVDLQSDRLGGNSMMCPGELNRRGKDYSILGVNYGVYMHGTNMGNRD